MKRDVWRAVIDVGFIIFLFYSNLLMGEFERSGMGMKRGLSAIFFSKKRAASKKAR